MSHLAYFEQGAIDGVIYATEKVMSLYVSRCKLGTGNIPALYQHIQIRKARQVQWNRTVQAAKGTEYRKFLLEAPYLIEATQRVCNLPQNNTANTM